MNLICAVSPKPKTDLLKHEYAYYVWSGYSSDRICNIFDILGLAVVRSLVFNIMKWEENIHLTLFLTMLK